MGIQIPQHNVEAKEQLRESTPTFHQVGSRTEFRLSAGATRALIPYGISQVLEFNLFTINKADNGVLFFLKL